MNESVCGGGNKAHLGMKSLFKKTTEVKSILSRGSSVSGFKYFDEGKVEF